VAMHWPVLWNGSDRHHCLATSTRSNRRNPCYLSASTCSAWSDGLVPLLGPLFAVACIARPSPRGLMLRCHPPIVGTDLQRDAAKRGGRTEMRRAHATFHRATDPSARSADCGARVANAAPTVATRAAAAGGRQAATFAATGNTASGRELALRRQERRTRRRKPKRSSD